MSGAPDLHGRGATAGRRALAAGLLLTMTYVALAALSGHLSPLARRPVLDGLGPLMPYRWVSPPPEVPDNDPPSPATFELPVRNGRTVPDSVVTPDAQVTIFLDRGAVITDHERVSLDVTPLDPATLAPLPAGLSAFGNAIHVEASQEPGGEPVSVFHDVLTILLYPETTSLHALTHELLYSADGKTWERLDSTESVVQQQVQAEIPGPGYVVVGGVPKVLTSPRPPGVGTGGAGTLATILLVVSVASLLLGIGMLVRARRAQASEPD